MCWGWDKKVQRWISTLTHNQKHTIVSFIYFLLRFTYRRKDLPISVKKQDICICRQQKSSWEHENRLLLFISYIKPSGKYSLHSVSLFIAIQDYIDTYKQVSSLQHINNFLFLLTRFKRNQLFTSQAVTNQTKTIKIFILKLGVSKYEKCLYTEIFYWGWWVPGGHPT